MSLLFATGRQSMGRFRASVAFLVALSLLTIQSAPVFGWFFEGHAQIADIAWTRLTPRARAAITDILKLGPQAYRPKSDSEADVRAAFARASGFADDIKNDRQTPAEYSVLLPQMNRLFFDGEPPANDNEANRCKTWHYYDVPLRLPEGVTAPPRRTSSILIAYPYAIVQLKRLSKTPEKERALQFWWLAWIEHLAGDAHQPLHCAESFQYEKEGDAGGNLFLLGFKDERDRQVRLHAYWDGAPNDIITHEKAQNLAVNLSAVTDRWTKELPESAFGTAVQRLSLFRWVADGASEAQFEVYEDIKPGEKRDDLKRSGYESRRDELAKRKAVLAGYRLAATLNRIFESPDQ